MTDLALKPAVAEEVSGRSLWQDAVARLVRNRAAVASLVLLSIVMVMAVFAPFLSPMAVPVPGNDAPKVEDVPPTAPPATTLTLTAWWAVSVASPPAESTCETLPTMALPGRSVVVPPLARSHAEMRVVWEFCVTGM